VYIGLSSFRFVSEDELDLWIPEDIYIEKPDLIFPSSSSCCPLRSEFNSFEFKITEPVEGRKKLLYFLPTTRKYLQELDDIAASKDSNALVLWSQEKKDIQAMRVTVRRVPSFLKFMLTSLFSFSSTRPCASIGTHTGPANAH
jgi:hypothetical protein